MTCVPLFVKGGINPEALELLPEGEVSVLATWGGSDSTIEKDALGQIGIVIPVVASFDVILRALRLATYATFIPYRIQAWLLENDQELLCRLLSPDNHVTKQQMTARLKAHDEKFGRVDGETGISDLFSPDLRLPKSLSDGNYGVECVYHEAFRGSTRPFFVNGACWRIVALIGPATPLDVVLKWLALSSVADVPSHLIDLVELEFPNWKYGKSISKRKLLVAHEERLKHSLLAHALKGVSCDAKKLVELLRGCVDKFPENTINDTAEKLAQLCKVSTPERFADFLRGKRVRWNDDKDKRAHELDGLHFSRQPLLVGVKFNVKIYDDVKETKVMFADRTVYIYIGESECNRLKALKSLVGVEKYERVDGLIVSGKSFYMSFTAEKLDIAIQDAPWVNYKTLF